MGELVEAEAPPHTLLGLVSATPHNRLECGEDVHPLALPRIFGPGLEAIPVLGVGQGSTALSSDDCGAGINQLRKRARGGGQEATDSICLPPPAGHSLAELIPAFLLLLLLIFIIFVIAVVVGRVIHRAGGRSRGGGHHQRPRQVRILSRKLCKVAVLQRIGDNALLLPQGHGARRPRCSPSSRLGLHLRCIAQEGPVDVSRGSREGDADARGAQKGRGGGESGWGRSVRDVDGRLL